MGGRQEMMRDAGLKLLSRPTVPILKVAVDVIDIPSAAKKILAWSSEEAERYICVAPVSTLVDGFENPAYRQILNEAAMVTPDGMPVVWTARMKGHGAVRRTYGPDLLLSVCREGVKTGCRHFFYGATPEVCQKLMARLEAEFPGIQIAGFFSPPYRREVLPESSDVLRRIEAARAQVLWVGLGSPKQDFWMKQHVGKIAVPVMVGVGAAFDFLSGVKPQAPRWIQNIGMEWFFRLCCEPRRLWKRYLVGNSKFLYYLLSETLKGR